MLLSESEQLAKLKTLMLAYKKAARVMDFEAGEYLAAATKLEKEYIDEFHA